MGSWMQLSVRPSPRELKEPILLFHHLAPSHLLLVLPLAQSSLENCRKVGLLQFSCACILQQGGDRWGVKLEKLEGHLQPTDNSKLLCGARKPPL